MEGESKSSNESDTRPKVLIIGAGMSGLICARHVKDDCDVTVVETRDNFGGQWYYTDKNEQNYPDIQNNAFYNLYGCLPSSLYAGVSLILPKFSMTFKDFPFPDDAPHVLSAEQFYNYICEYVRHFDLEKYISYNTTVTKIKPVEGEERRYLVHTSPTDLTKAEEEKKEEFYDKVVICANHFSVPHIPDFEGLDEFEGVKMHMHHIKEVDPEIINGKNVLVVGVSISALDFVNMLFFKQPLCDTLNPNKVFITSKNCSKMDTSDDYKAIINEEKLCVKHGNVSKLESGKKVYFGDGTDETIDTIIF